MGQMDRVAAPLATRNMGEVATHSPRGGSDAVKCGGRYREESDQEKKMSSGHVDLMKDSSKSKSESRISLEWCQTDGFLMLVACINVAFLLLITNYVNLLNII